MAARHAVCALPLCLAAHACAQPTAHWILYGLRANGDLVWINHGTGAATLIGSSGVACQGAFGLVSTGSRAPCYEDFYTAGGPLPDQITAVNSGGVVHYSYQITGLPAGYTIRDMAGPPAQFAARYILLSPQSPTGVDLLASLSETILSIIGPTGRTDLEGLALSPGGVLYALGTGDGGVLCRLDAATGAAMVIGGGNFGEDTYSLHFLSDGRLLACGANLRSVDPATGAAQVIGPTGYSDIRALATLVWPGSPCYANCDCAGPPPVLSVADFTCFLQRFAAGHPYANCDMSTTPPVLNVADFTCFLQTFASACQ
jgi:hypothetical protein